MVHRLISRNSALSAIRCAPTFSNSFCSTKLYSNESSYQVLPSRDIDASQLTIRTTHSPQPKPAVKDLKFGSTFTDHMLTVSWSEQSNQWSLPQIKPFTKIELDPSSSVLQYATTCFEGMKAYKSSKDQSVRLFRPNLNMERLNRSAGRLAFPRFDGPSLLECIKKLVKLDSDWIPSYPGYSLYIRPTIIGSSPGLGVSAPHEVTLYVICSPVGPYYPKGFQPISLLATTKYCRAWPGGSGGHKLGANYPTGILAQAEAKLEGYDQVLWLFGDDDQVTEVGTMNIFIALESDEGDIELVTPPLDDKILPGVIRDSTIRLVKSHLNQSQKLKDLPINLKKMSERPITMRELVDKFRSKKVLEVFGTGTAAVVSPIESIQYRGSVYRIPVDAKTGLGPIANVMQREIQKIQTGEIESDWSVLV